MMPDQLREVVTAAVSAELASRGLGQPVTTDTVAISRPRDPGHGDYASSVALQLSGPAGVPARELAGAIAARLDASPGLAEVQVAGPGFLNIRLTDAAVGGVAAAVLAEGPSFGRGRTLAGQRVNLEFVSANPTGPITLAGARWAAAGDALARLLRAQDAAVTTEYYFNDAGAQIDRFAASLLAVAQDRPVPDDGYQGEYIGELVGQILARHPDAADRQDALSLFRSAGVALMLDEIKATLSDFGVPFDVYFSERTLHERSELAAALGRLDQLGHVYRAEGAVWVRTSAFGDDKDRVFKRSDGSYTYFGADCAYYLDKRSRGFGKVMIILGADHHGYVGRMRAVSACFGDDPDATLEILIGQLVSLVRGGRVVRLSKRAGDVITLTDVVSAIGTDAARYAMVRYAIDSPIDIDMDLWSQRSADNPVFYVQYAHARICALQRSARQAGVSRGETYDPALLGSAVERDLLKDLADFPAVVASAADLRQPHRVARHLEQVAGSYHRFYDACRVLPAGGEPPPDVGAARLWLVDAARVVLANGFGLLGVSAPEQM
jgi:arginyl-tRNA synthetase